VGGNNTGPTPTDRATGGVKRRLVTEGHGGPLGGVREGANRHAMKRVRASVNRLVGKRPPPTGEQPQQGRCLDKGDDDQDGRQRLEEFGFTAPRRSRGEAAPAIKAQARQKARRWVVERTHSWLNRFRRILVRWDKKPEHDLAFLHFACALIAFPVAELFGSALRGCAALQGGLNKGFDKWSGISPPVVEKIFDATVTS
jgi:putative transposase